MSLRRIGWVSAVWLSTLSIPLAAQTQQWKKYVYRDDKFQVEFSAEPTISPTFRTDGQERIARSTDYQQDGGTYTYIVGVTIAKHGIDFEKGVEASFKSFNCKSGLSSKPVPLAGGKGLERRGSDCADGTLRVISRYFAIASTFHQVIAVFNTENGDEASASHFVQSFRVIK